MHDISFAALATGIFFLDLPDPGEKGVDSEVKDARDDVEIVLWGFLWCLFGLVVDDVISCWMEWYGVFLKYLAVSFTVSWDLSWSWKRWSGGLYSDWIAGILLATRT